MNKNILKFSIFCLLVLGLVVMAASGSWATGYTMDDVMKEALHLRIGQARLEEGLKALNTRINDARGTLNLFGSMLAIITALVVGVFGFVVYIARTIRPAEDRVIKVEQSLERLKDYLGKVSDKLHIQKPIL